MALIEKNRKKIFLILLFISFGMLYLYNMFTPILSDDIFYQISARNAGSLGELLKIQYNEYLSNNGRYFNLLNCRLFLIPDKWVFNIVNSAMFVLLSVLMYLNIEKRKKNDIFVIILTTVFLWRYSVSFGQTILWLCGATNYLWSTTIILGFITFFRHIVRLDSENEKPFLGKGLILVVFTFLFGAYAGICSENTSGGGVLLVLIFSINYLLDKPKDSRKIKPYMIAAFLGMCTGLMALVAAPGVSKRATVMSSDENYSGALKYLSHLYKLTVSIQNRFSELLMVLIVVLVILVLQKKFDSFEKLRRHNMIIFLFVGVATAYALVIAPTSQDRALFGAGIYLMIACINGIADVKDDELTLKALKYSFLCIICLSLFFTYFINLVNLQRIDREEKERIELIKAAHERGEDEVVVAQLRPEFDNEFTVAYYPDMEEDPGFWINTFYEVMYDVGSVTAIPRDEWNAIYGGEEFEGSSGD